MLDATIRLGFKIYHFEIPLRSKMTASSKLKRSKTETDRQQTQTIRNCQIEKFSFG